MGAAFSLPTPGTPISFVVKIYSGPRNVFFQLKALLDTTGVSIALYTRDLNSQWPHDGVSFELEIHLYVGKNS
jgi:hypothetical protein